MVRKCLTGLSCVIPRSSGVFVELRRDDLTYSAIEETLDTSEATPGEQYWDWAEGAFHRAAQLEKHGTR